MFATRAIANSIEGEAMSHNVFADNPEKVRAHNEKAKQYQRLCRAKNLPYVVMSGSVCNEAEEAMSHKEGDRGYRA